METNTSLRFRASFPARLDVLYATSMDAAIAKAKEIHATTGAPWVCIEDSATNQDYYYIFW